MKITHTLNNKHYSWKAVYLYGNGQSGKQIAHLGIDPFSDYGMLKPQVFAGVGNRVWRFNLPHLKSSRKHVFLSKLENLQNKFWYSWRQA